MCICKLEQTFTVVEDRNVLSLPGYYHTCWCKNNTRNHENISNHDDLVLLEYTGFSVKRVNIMHAVFHLNYLNVTIIVNTWT